MVFQNLETRLPFDAAMAEVAQATTAAPVATQSNAAPATDSGSTESPQAAPQNQAAPVADGGAGADFGAGAPAQNGGLSATAVDQVFGGTSGDSAVAEGEGRPAADDVFGAIGGADPASGGNVIDDPIMDTPDTPMNGGGNGGGTGGGRPDLVDGGLSPDFADRFDPGTQVDIGPEGGDRPNPTDAFGDIGGPDSEVGEGEGNGGDSCNCGATATANSSSESSATASAEASAVGGGGVIGQTRGGSGFGSVFFAGGCCDIEGDIDDLKKLLDGVEKRINPENLEPRDLLPEELKGGPTDEDLESEGPDMIIDMSTTYNYGNGSSGVASPDLLAGIIGAAFSNGFGAGMPDLSGLAPLGLLVGSSVVVVGAVKFASEQNQGISTSTQTWSLATAN